MVKPLLEVTVAKTPSGLRAEEAAVVALLRRKAKHKVSREPAKLYRYGSSRGPHAACGTRPCGCKWAAAAGDDEEGKDVRHQMRDAVLLAVRVLAGGALVVAFAMISNAVKPKMFAGLFSGAPSVATASLLVNGLAMGAAKDEKYATGMIAGAIGLVFFSAAAAFLVKRLGSITGSALAWLVGRYRRSRFTRCF